LQNGDKDIEVTDIWKRHPKTVRGGSPHNAFKRWRKSAGLKLSESKSAISGSRLAVGDKGGDEDMSLLKFLAIVSVRVGVGGAGHALGATINSNATFATQEKNQRTRVVGHVLGDKFFFGAIDRNMNAVPPKNISGFDGDATNFDRGALLRLGTRHVLLRFASNRLYQQSAKVFGTDISGRFVCSVNQPC
jgi:hypothetical protein